MAPRIEVKREEEALHDLGVQTAQKSAVAEPVVRSHENPGVGELLELFLRIDKGFPLTG